MLLLLCIICTHVIELRSPSEHFIKVLTSSQTKPQIYQVALLSAR